MANSPSSFALALGDIAWEAGEIILRHYEEGTDSRKKSDHSPVTDADEEAERFILQQLAKIAPGVPVIAEEEAAAGRIAEIGAHFFLVDPLDGTKEFLNRNGEFTVNIAEIKDGVPVRGVVHAPAKQRLFLGDGENGAFEIATAPGIKPDFTKLEPIRVRTAPADGMIAVASRSHRDHKTDEYLNHYNVKDFITAGSSLKFCLVAAGEADIYPRHGPTCEWDTAAGHAVLNAAGGTVTRPDGTPFLYGKTRDKFLNGYFVARGLA
ncbi:MAG: 3'(2'),5'-bisphosphate nucleotidase CysQ [Alphaproteobacteria bacterium]|nr:3'(2'),5'-bisphosphate nucleotidase CysQ [Alphaproteobacteria bacterium]